VSDLRAQLEAGLTGHYALLRELGYARFVRLWMGCDMRLRPAMEDARARLARLTGEPRT
jgi:hypothetical protein